MTSAERAGTLRRAQGKRVVLALRKQQRHREAYTPVRAALRFVEIRTPAAGNAEALAAELHDFGIGEVGRNGAFLGLPVVRGFEIDRQRASLAQRTREKRLQKR